MGESHGAGGEDHQHREDPLDAGEAATRIGSASGSDAQQQDDAQAHHQAAGEQRQAQRLEAGKLQADMLQALADGHQRDHEARQEHVQRHVAARAAERVLGMQYQPLHAPEQGEGEQPGQHRRHHPTGDDRADRAPSAPRAPRHRPRRSR